ncbi:MAG: hypothetical protein J6B84_01505 [Eubacterium sp.]|nr:hypothetical protein [Eubacterium sp.]
MDWVFGENEIMKGREHMFELLQNEYEEYREYFKELELIQRQYNQEEAYYFIINKLIRDSIDDKDISVRDVHKLIRAKDFPGRNSYLRGYAGQVPDFVILHNDFEESKGGNQSDKVYGCVEIKPFSKENKKLDRNYIQPIKDLLKNKELVKAVHEELRQKGIKIEFESGQEKEAFIKNYFKEDNNKSIPIDVMGEMFLCNKNGDLCKNESKELIKQKLLKIQKRNDKGFLVLHANGNEYPVELKSKKTKESSPLEKIVFDNEIVFDNGIVCELLKELIGFKKVIFTNGYQWILMQCKEVEYSETNFEKVKDRNGIKVMSLIMVKDFQCESLADFYSEPKDEETFAELQQHNFEQWLHLKLEINRIFKEAKSQNKQGEEKIGNDE